MQNYFQSEFNEDKKVKYLQSLKQYPASFEREMDFFKDEEIFDTDSELEPTGKRIGDYPETR